MAVNYDQTTQNARLDATLARIDNHANPATLEICTASYAAVLVAIPLADPSFTRSGVIPDTLLLMASMPRSAVAGNTGPAAVARIKDGGGVVIVNGLTVGTSGQDVNLNSVSISSGQTVTLTNPSTIKHSP